MASYQILRDVNESLRDMLWEAISADQILKKVIPTRDSISFLNPTQASEDSSNRLSLWLYHIDLNGILRNQVMPAVSAGADGEDRRVIQPLPPIPLDLHYLVTPLVEPGEGDLVVLGKAIQVFYSNGSFDVRDREGDGSQSLRLIFEQLGVDQVSLLWQALSSTMRLSVGYLVRVTQIDGTRGEPTSRVTERAGRAARVGEVAR